MVCSDGNNSYMIQGVQLRPLNVIADERGAVMHMLKASDPHFEHFGEIYFSLIYPNAIKAWHLHKEMTLNYAVPSGMIKLVLYDDRPNSETRGEVNEFFLGDRNYALVTIPPNIWNGFKSIVPGVSLVANCATVPHRTDEIVRRDPFDTTIPYDWSIKHG